jgi:predicted short-subunit dehydrogenase-like oxidoreductase (DUF2520 family)
VAEQVPDVTIVLVGPGRAGRAFARSWTRAGGSIVLAARDASAARAFAGEIEHAEARGLEDGAEPLAADVLVLAVPDDAIAPVASRLSQTVACRFAFHLSGALTAAALAPFRARRAGLGSMHPLRAFTGSQEEGWRGAFVAVEGEDAASDVAGRICRAVGARPRAVTSSGKPLYHAAATLAAGGSGALISMAARLWSEAGLSEDEGRVELADLAATAIEAVRRVPFGEALTGPLARRDLRTVALHVRLLAGQPDLFRLYSLLARETLRRTSGRGREDEIRALLDASEAASGEKTPGPSGDG